MSSQQAAQLTHILNERVKDLSEEVDWEKAGREEAVKTAKEKTKTAEAAEKRAAVAEKSQVSAEKRSAELVTKQNEMDLKLAKAASLNVTLSEEVADLRVALEACESKWYDEGFADVEKGVELIVMQARQLSVQEGRMAALQALGVPEESLLRDHGRIPFPNPSPAAQNPVGPNDEEETESLRELVEQIDNHVEMIETEATSNPLLMALPAKMFILNLLHQNISLPRWHPRCSPWILPLNFRTYFTLILIRFYLVIFILSWFAYVAELW